MIINQNVSGGGSSPAPADPMSLKLKVGNGQLYHDNTSAVSTTIDFTGVSILTNFVLAYAYRSNTTITGAAFRNGSNISEIWSHGADSAFSGCTGITSIGLMYLYFVNEYGLTFTFSGCTGITSAPFISTVASIESHGMHGTFYNCTNLTGNISFDNLGTLTGNNNLAYAFANTGITSLSFPALANVEPDDVYYPDPEDPESGDEYSCSMFDYMLQGCSNVTVHFPSNFEGRLDLWASFQNGFGGTNTTVLFDLDPTVEPEEPEEPEEPFEEEPIEEP